MPACNFERFKTGSLAQNRIYNKNMEASARPQRLSLAMAGAATHFSLATSLAWMKKIERFKTKSLAYRINFLN